MVEAETLVQSKWVGLWKRYTYRLLAAEISSIARYYDELIYFQPLPHDGRQIFEGIECPAKSICETSLPDLNAGSRAGGRVGVLINGNFNYHYDIQGYLQQLRTHLARESRILAIVYNPYLKWIYSFFHALGLRQGPMPTTFLTRSDLKQLAKLAGYDVVRVRVAGYFPFRLLGLGSAINWLCPMIPGLKWLAVSSLVVFRPIKPSENKPSLSVVIPARNEAGNIENAITRLAKLNGEIPLEIVFVEGNSTDDTWAEIQRVKQKYSGDYKITTFKQEGKGKNDAVRVGFRNSTGDLLTILDADLTMPPELLHRFYDAYTQGLGDFVNGSRLVYPMESDAMRFLNWLGNIFFAKSISAVVGNRFTDTLCGTKLLSRRDYARVVAWRDRFGDFDPFGDFELLFGATCLALGTTDIPIRYRDRTYGSTNIHRFRHGLILLKMTAIGLFRITPGRT